MVDLRSQYAGIRAEVEQGMAQVLESCAFINGPDVKAFGAELAAYLEAESVVPCGNGTDALQIALMSLDLQPGDEVITTPFTFVATAEVIALLGLKPVFADINPVSFNMDVERVRFLITERTKCILPVHLFGQSCDMEPLVKLAQRHNLKIVEDNAQSIGAKYTFSDGHSQHTGTIGDIGCTSFYPTKNLGAYGDGGAVICNDPELAAKIERIANHGSDRKYYYDAIGVNSRLDSFQAIVLRAKLKRLNSYNMLRKAAARSYNSLLKDVSQIQTPQRVPNSDHVYHQYTLRVQDGRDELQEFLASKGIPSMIYYPVPLHLSKAYARYGYEPGDFPESEKAAKEVLSLPMHSELDEEQIAMICSSIIEFYR